MEPNFDLFQLGKASDFTMQYLKEQQSKGINCLEEVDSFICYLFGVLYHFQTANTVGQGSVL